MTYCYGQAHADLQRLTVRAVRPGLTRTKVLLAALDHPDRACPAIQITGTNGKGSVAALLASALTTAGYRVGRFTSPHLKNERERIMLATRIISPQAFAAAVKRMLPPLRALQRAGNPATVFEAWTVLAAVAFQAARLDVAVLEVGMGGRLDATTAWQNIILSVLTNVSLDHTRELGPDVESICREKIAIARPGVPLVTAEADPKLRALILRYARERSFPVRFAGTASGDSVQLERWQRTDQGIRLALKTETAAVARLEVPLRGAFQAHNAALAVLAVQELEAKGFRVPPAAMRTGFAAVTWPGRLELAATRPKVFLDGAHNPAAAQAVALELQAIAGKAYLVVGVMADKDVSAMTRVLAPAAARIWTVTPPDRRALAAQDLAAWFLALGIQAEAKPSYRSALTAACQAAGARGTVAVVGSLYNIAPARAALRTLYPRKRLPKNGRRK